jgi:hypothetical protein
MSYYGILSSVMCIQVWRAPEFHNDFWQIFCIFFKNNFTRINHCKFTHHKSHLKPFVSYLPCIVRREYFSIIFNAKKCTLYSIKYGNFNKNLSIVFLKCLTIMNLTTHNLMNSFLTEKGPNYQKIKFNHRHLSNIDCLMAHTACLVCFISTVNDRIKKNLGRLVLVAST